MGNKPLIFLTTILTLPFPAIGLADVVTEWSLKSAQFTVAGRLPPPDAWNVLATTGVAVSDALAAISGKSGPILVKVNPVPDASMDAAVAAASHAVLLKTIPAQHENIEAAYQAAIAKVPDGASKQNGIAVGSQAAEMVLQARPKDEAIESYRPFTTAGKYVPTILPVSLTVALRKPWVLELVRSVPASASAGFGQRHLGARLQRDQGSRRSHEFQPYPRADGCRTFLGGDESDHSRPGH